MFKVASFIKLRYNCADLLDRNGVLAEIRRYKVVHDLKVVMRGNPFLIERKDTKYSEKKQIENFTDLNSFRGCRPDEEFAVRIFENSIEEPGSELFKQNIGTSTH